MLNQLHTIFNSKRLSIKAIGKMENLMEEGQSTFNQELIFKDNYLKDKFIVKMDC